MTSAGPTSSARAGRTVPVAVCRPRLPTSIPPHGRRAAPRP